MEQSSYNSLLPVAQDKVLRNLFLGIPPHVSERIGIKWLIHCL